MVWLIVIGVLVLSFSATWSAYAANVVTRALLVVSFIWIGGYWLDCYPNPPYSMAGMFGPPAVLWVAVILLRWIFIPPRPPYLRPPTWPQ